MLSHLKESMVSRAVYVICAILALVSSATFALVLFKLLIVPLLDKSNTQDFTASFISRTQVRLADLVQGNVICAFPPRSWVFASVRREFGDFVTNRYADFKEDSFVWVIAGFDTTTRRLQLGTVDDRVVHFPNEEKTCGANLHVAVKNDGNRIIAIPQNKSD